MVESSSRSFTSNTPEGFRSGFVALIGRPNVGKSTLVNQLIGDKIAITSPVAQTTRNRLRAILTTDEAQLILVDTPGIHKPHHLLGERLVQSARTFAAVCGTYMFWSRKGSSRVEDTMLIIPALSSPDTKHRRTTLTWCCSAGSTSATCSSLWASLIRSVYSRRCKHITNSGHITRCYTCYTHPTHE